MEVLILLIPTLILLALLSKFEWRGLAKNLPAPPPLPRFIPGTPAWQQILIAVWDVFRVLGITFWQISKFSLRCALAIAGIKKPSS